MPPEKLLGQVNPFYTNAAYSIEQARVYCKGGAVKPQFLSFLAWDASLTLAQRTYNLNVFLLPPPDHVTTLHPRDRYCACVMFAEVPDAYTPGRAG